MVATDSEEILRFCEQQGFAVRMTSRRIVGYGARAEESQLSSRPMYISTFRETNRLRDWNISRAWLG